MAQNSIMILYLHGFLGSSHSQKARWYQAKFAEIGIEVFAPTYPQKTPDESITFLDDYLQQHFLKKSQAWGIIGSSLGGYFGQYFANEYQVPLLMINPALHPLRLFKDYLGPQRHPHTGETFEVDDYYLTQLQKYDCEAIQHSSVMLLQDKEDEVVPYQWANEKYAQTALINLYEGGEHRFLHLDQSWEDVKNFTLNSMAVIE